MVAAIPAALAIAGSSGTVMAGLSAAAGLMDFVGARQSAADQTSANNAARDNAITSMNADLKAIQERRYEEKSAASQKLIDSQRQALAERGTAQAAAAAIGQSGLSVTALMNDYLRQQEENEVNISTNLANTNAQLDRERTSVINTAQGRVTSLPSVSSPSFLGSALKIGTGAVTAYNAATKNTGK